MSELPGIRLHKNINILQSISFCVICGDPDITPVTIVVDHTRLTEEALHSTLKLSKKAPETTTLTDRDKYHP